MIPGTVERSPKFRKYLQTRCTDVLLDTEVGLRNMVAFEVPGERVDRFIVRLTKGLLRQFHPEYEYQSADFQVRHIEPTEEVLINLEEILVGTKYEERGDGVVRLRHGITDTGLGGIWLFIFYDAVWSLVIHKTQARQ